MINTALLPADKDPMGAAIADYFKRHKADRLRVFSSQFDEDEIPVEELFRTEKQMPLLERTALQMATGKILDVGAGSGCHSLTLQEAGKEVHAIDISPLSVEVMKQRGVRSVSQTNLFNEQFAATTSEEIRKTFKMKRERGEFIGAFATYGYKKDPNDKNSLLVD